MCIRDRAVIISHSHVDHFGGIACVMAKEDKADETLSIEDQLASGKIPVITPVGFTEHSVKENVYAGKGMGRRSNYQYGKMCIRDRANTAQTDNATVPDFQSVIRSVFM